MVSKSMALSEQQLAPWHAQLEAYLLAFPKGAEDAYGYRYFFRLTEMTLAEDGSLIIGSVGADSMDFRLSAEAPGVWVYRPIEKSYEFLERDIVVVVKAWIAGQLSV